MTAIQIKMVNRVLTFYRAAGVNRRHAQIMHLKKEVKLVEFDDCVCNHHEKCIKINTTMPSVDLVIRKINFVNLKILINQLSFAWSN